MSLRCLFPLLATAFVAQFPTLASAETGTVRAQFVFAGSAIDPVAIDPNKDTEFCGKHPLVNERLLVNKENNGIKNVAFFVYTGRGGSKVDPPKSEPKTVVLANDKCRFEPRVVVLQVGDTLEITNPDAVGHNANINFFANQSQNPMIPPNGSVKVKIEKPELGVVPVACNIHPWMLAQIVALDHPYAGISDEDGMVEIKDLPTGEKLVFRINHEAANSGIKAITMLGKTESLKKNLIEIEIKPGMNDLGKIIIPADTLTP